MTAPERLHPRVPHPLELLKSPGLSRVNEWVTDHLTMALGSVTGMWLAFIVPLLAFEIPWLLKVLGLVSSYWVQLWALFVLQRSAGRGDAQRAAKADADHAALSHIALTADAIHAAVTGPGTTAARLAAAKASAPKLKDPQQGAGT